MKVVCLLLILFGLLQFSFCSEAHARPWTVKDSVELAILEYPIYSPDRKQFVTCSSRGKLDTNQIESSIWLFNTAEVKGFCADNSTKQASLGQKVVSLAADTFDDTGYPRTITNICWSSDGSKIYFLQRGKHWERRISSCEIKTRKVSFISPEREDIASFQITGHSAIYLSSKSPAPESWFQAGSSDGAPDIVRGAGYSSTQLAFPNFTQSQYGLAPLTIGIIDLNKSEQQQKLSGIKGKTSFYSLSPTLSASPDAKYAVSIAQAKTIPAQWEEYEPNSKDYSRIKSRGSAQDKSQIHKIEQFVLQDLSTGEQRPLLDAPTAGLMGYTYEDEPTIAWSPDSSKVAVSGTFLPISDSSAKILRPCTVVVDVKDNCKTHLLPGTEYGNKDRFPTYSITWLKGSSLEIEGNGRKQVYELNKNGDWTKNGDAQKANEKTKEDLSIYRYQDFDRPTVLIGYTGKEQLDIPELLKTNKGKIFFDPNAYLANVDFGSTSFYSWKDKEGRECKGALLKPPDFQRGKRYPLLIETHSLSEYEFFNKSSSTTPGRVAVSRGMLVLQTGEPRRGSNFRGTELESEKDGKDCYVAAIQQLEKEGLVDPTRVGIVAYSRTGWYVLDTLIKEPRYIRAASIVDANSSSYGEYLRNLDISSGGNYLDRDYGCKPFGAGLRKWIDKASGFNLDKIQAPVLVQVNSPYGLLDWSTYPVLRMMNKPVDLLYFRNGAHTNSKPKLINASIETNIDWFDFWLNEHEDPSPEKAEQYTRWRTLRELAEANRTH